MDILMCGGGHGYLYKENHWFYYKRQSGIPADGVPQGKVKGGYAVKKIAIGEDRDSGAIPRMLRSI